MISINFGKNIHPANNAIIFIKLLIKLFTQIIHLYWSCHKQFVATLFFNLPSFLSSFQLTSIRDLGKNSVQSLSHVRLCDLMDCGLPRFPVHHQVPQFMQASLVAQTVKRLPAMQGTWVQFLGREDPLEK